MALSRQFCENVLVHPRRRLLHEGPLHLIESQQRTVELYAFVFNDLFLLTKVKRIACKNKSVERTIDQTRYVVHRQPVPMDSCVLCDVSPQDAPSLHCRSAFVIIHLTRFYQVIAVYTLQASSVAEKEIWLSRFHESIENYESIQQRDVISSISVLNGLVSKPNHSHSDLHSLDNHGPSED